VNSSKVIMVLEQIMNTVECYTACLSDSGLKLWRWAVPFFLILHYADSFPTCVIMCMWLSNVFADI
jgi:hypothetical protein